MLSRAHSSLPDETEDLIHRIIGCAIEVHTRLGAGYVEAVYHKATCIELQHQGLAFATEHRVEIKYRDRVIHAHRLDLVVEKQVVLELKAVDRLDYIHTAQLVSYVRALKVRVGLLINFNTDHLKGSIRRVVV
jgi:GxxExxY protein